MTLTNLIPATIVGLLLAIVTSWRRIRRERWRQLKVAPASQVDPERAFIASLDHLSACIRDTNPDWADKLRETASRADDVFAKSHAVESKYGFVRNVEGYFGGMGSLDDGTPKGCHQELQALWSSVQTLLRIYWRQLGKEHHNYASFSVFGKGTQVKLVAGKVRYYESDGKPVHVITAEASLGRLWIVERCFGPDITNMPHYDVRNGDTFMSARHEALVPVDKHE